MNFKVSLEGSLFFEQVVSTHYSVTLAPVHYLKLRDDAIYWINPHSMISVKKNNHAIQWMAIYAMDSTIPNNLGLV